MATSKQADIHMHMRNAVTLVWGSLRLAPMMDLEKQPSETRFHMVLR